MKRISILMAVIFATATMAFASGWKASNQIFINNLEVVHEYETVEGFFNIDATNVSISTDRELLVTPYLKGSNGSVKTLPAITVAGRNRFYYHLRNDQNLINGKNLFHNTDAIVSAIPYYFSIPYEKWMDNCELLVEIEMRGCCGKTDTRIMGVPVASLDMAPRVYAEQYVYEVPATEKVKIRHESGSAFIDFVIGKSEIDPNYKNNPIELEKIKETIDAVRTDKDLTIKSISITGYASPDGPESINNRLSAERAASLLSYVKGISTLKGISYSSDGKGEDWEGVIRFLETSLLPNRDAILGIAKSGYLSDDEKDATIKEEYPSDYAYLLENVYPGLRRSDYVVEYSVKEYSNVSEIISILNTNPKKLSLNEIFIAAETMTPGSDSYNNAFLTAVTLFPEDEVANLNAALVSIDKGDYAAAEKYLAKAGNSDIANYNRGLLAAKQKDYETARSFFLKARTVPEAEIAVRQVEAIIANPAGGVHISNYNRAILK